MARTCRQCCHCCRASKPKHSLCGGLLFAQWWYFDAMFMEGRCSPVCLFAIAHKANSDLNPNYFRSSRILHFYDDENCNTEDLWLTLSLWYVVLSSWQPLKEPSYGGGGHGVSPPNIPMDKNSRQQKPTEPVHEKGLPVRCCGGCTDFAFAAMDANWHHAALFL